MSISDGWLGATLVNDTSVGNHHGCDIVKNQIVHFCAASAISINATVPVRTDWRRDAYISKINSSDLVIVNGEGSVHHGRDFAKDMLRVVEHCNAEGIPAFFINGVYQCNDTETDALMRKFDSIWVRESLSQNSLSASGIEAKVAPDMVISLKPGVNKDRWFSFDVLYTDSVDSETTRKMYALAGANHGGRAGFISLKKIGKKGLRGNFMAFLHRYRQAMQKEISNTPINPAGMSSYCRTLDDLLSVILSSRLLVTGRFHMVCLCLILEIPFLAVRSNSHKIEGMLNDVGLSNRIIEEAALDSESLQSAQQWTDEELLKLRCWLSRSRDDIKALFDTLYESASYGQ